MMNTLDAKIARSVQYRMIKKLKKNGLPVYSFANNQYSEMKDYLTMRRLSGYEY